ncbi:MAG: response regulator [Lachnospiraceae bacterium]|nr:response regulator [Lachnospiraceae bacterium]
MANDRILITGEKESFLIRVLAKKVSDAGIRCKFVPWTVNEINKEWDEVCLVVMYIESDRRPASDVTHFLNEKMIESGVQFIPIGDGTDVKYMLENVPADLIYRAYTRPIDNEKFVSDITELHRKISTGEFRKSILIVDDDPNYLALIRDWLKNKYKVAMANSGLQALKWLGKNKADLILLDYEMPVTSGPQVLEMLRSESETKDIPVMFLTGRGDKESVMNVLALKPEGYFLKTIEKDDLHEKLAEFFAK